MPYIKNHKREKICKFPEGHLIVDSKELKTPGDLNYALTMLCSDYLESSGLNYNSFNDIIGALEGAKLEFYRRQVSNYEDKKIEENGDIYEE